METWKLEELQVIAQEIVDKTKERGESKGFFIHETNKIYLECECTADYTPVVYYRDTGYEGGDLCGLDISNIDGCWIDAEGSEFDLTEEEKQALQDAVNELIH